MNESIETADASVIIDPVPHRLSRRRRFAASDETEITHHDVVIVDATAYSPSPRPPQRRRRRMQNIDYVDLTCVQNDDVVDLTSPSPSQQRTQVNDRVPRAESTPEVDSTTPPILRVNCPICLEPLSSIIRRGVQIRSTNCGHVFCKPCIRTAILATRKCPTCRKRITERTTHPLYLPIS